MCKTSSKGDPQCKPVASGNNLFLTVSRLGKHGLFSLFHSSARAATKPKVTEKQVKGRGVDAKVLDFLPPSD
jgi:hypothetical protein